MNFFKKTELLLVSLLCFSLFSFKSVDSNEKRLSNLDIYKNVQIDDKDGNSSNTYVMTGLVRTAVKAWQKSSREIVYAAVALWPFTLSTDIALEELRPVREENIHELDEDIQQGQRFVPRDDLVELKRSKL